MIHIDLDKEASLKLLDILGVYVAGQQQEATLAQEARVEKVKAHKAAVEVLTAVATALQHAYSAQAAPPPQSVQGPSAATSSGLFPRFIEAASLNPRALLQFLGQHPDAVRTLKSMISAVEEDGIEDPEEGFEENCPSLKILLTPWSKGATADTWVRYKLGSSIVAAEVRPRCLEYYPFGSKALGFVASYTDQYGQHLTLKDNNGEVRTWDNAGAATIVVDALLSENGYALNLDSAPEKSDAPLQETKLPPVRHILSKWRRLNGGGSLVRTMLTPPWLAVAKIQEDVERTNLLIYQEGDLPRVKENALESAIAFTPAVRVEDIQEYCDARLLRAGYSFEEYANLPQTKLTPWVAVSVGGISPTQAWVRYVDGTAWSAAEVRKTTIWEFTSQEKPQVRDQITASYMDQYGQVDTVKVSAADHSFKGKEWASVEDAMDDVDDLLRGYNYALPEDQEIQ